MKKKKRMKNTYDLDSLNSTNKMPKNIKFLKQFFNKLFFYFFIFPDEITASFRRYGPLIVDWPHKAESKSYFPPKGYAFLLFQVCFYCSKLNIKYIHSLSTFIFRLQRNLYCCLLKLSNQLRVSMCGYVCTQSL